MKRITIGHYATIIAAAITAAAAVPAKAQEAPDTRVYGVGYDEQYAREDKLAAEQPVITASPGTSSPKKTAPNCGIQVGKGGHVSGVTNNGPGATTRVGMIGSKPGCPRM